MAPHCDSRREEIAKLQDRQVLLTQGARVNPFNAFLMSVQRVMKIAWSAAAQRAIDPARYEAFTLNHEERNYAKDIVARVEMLGHSFERLCGLGIEWHEIQSQMRENQPYPNSIDLSRVRPAVRERDKKWRLDVDLVASFAHYEIKSLSDMLRSWGLTVDGPELKYILKTRNRFLAHPRYGGVMRMANRSVSIPFDGGPVEASITGLNQSDPFTLSHYLAVLNMAQPIDHNAERAANEQIVLSSDQNHQLDQREVVRLKAFGVREPNLIKALRELAVILEQQALPKIQAAFDEAVTQFGFERF